ncbi:hypothetical protein F2Q70_00017333 [Brassica cretica]|uniref:MATH domain-containing protein n=1 Tax=Brassica cretica TaxID=69181 RepID=A0A8S9I1Q7_BRACR|nr:hypothetical protein F2Q70_00017333 [Brassica cretica]
MSEKQGAKLSPIFASSSGCEWSVEISWNGHLSMYLHAESLRPGSLRRAIWRFRLLDTSGEYLLELHEVCGLFCAEEKILLKDYDNILSLSEKGKLIIEDK